MGYPASGQSRTKAASKPDIHAKHRRSGSVTNISITSENFNSPSGDREALSSPGSSSSGSFREQRIKRRTRSLLGGTEDVIKDFDLLAPSPRKKEIHSSKELAKLSSTAECTPLSEAVDSPPNPFPVVSVPDDLPAVSEAERPSAGKVNDNRLDSNLVRPEESIEPRVVGPLTPGTDGADIDRPEDAEANINQFKKAEVEFEDKSIQPGVAGHLSSGIDRAETQRPDVVDTSFKESKGVGDEAEGKRVEPDLAGRLSSGIGRSETPADVAASANEFKEAKEEVDDSINFGSPSCPKKGKSPEASVVVSPKLGPEWTPGPTEPVDALRSGKEVFATIISENGHAAEDPISFNGGARNSPEFLGGEAAKLSIVLESEAGIGGDSVNLPSNGGESNEDLVNQDMLRAQQEDERKEEEKVSVQKRIEQLERIAGGKPMHFRSQSWSQPRPLDVAPSRHHEAEVRHGFKLPLYKAPLDVSIAEGESSELVEISQDAQDLTPEVPESFTKALISSDCPALPANSFAESIAHESEASGMHAELQKDLDEEGDLKPEVVDSVALVDSSRRGACDSPTGLQTGLCRNGSVERHLGNRPTAEEYPPISLKCDEHVSVGEEKAIRGSVLSNEIKAGVVAGEEIETVYLSEENTSLGGSSGISQGADCRLEPVHDYVGVSTESSLEETLLGKSIPAKASSTADIVAEGGIFETSEVGILVEIPETSTSVRVVRPTVEIPETSTSVEVVRPTVEIPETSTSVEVVRPTVERSYQEDDAPVLLTKQPAVDPLFVDSQQDRLWEMHSQELSRREGEASVPEVRESSAQDDDPSQNSNGASAVAESVASGSTPNGNSQSQRSNKMDRPRTPLRSLLAEEEAAEKCSGSDAVARIVTIPHNQVVSPRGNLFRRIVSGGRNSPTKPTTPSDFSPKNQTSAKPFLSSCICCSPVK